MNLPTAPTWAYLLSAFVIGVLASLGQDLPIGSAEWFGAACAPLLLGLLIGAVIRRFRTQTNVSRVAFWCSLIVWILTALPTQTP